MKLICHHNLVASKCALRSSIFIPELIRLYKNGEFPIDKIITTYPFKQLEQAIKDSHDGKIIKAVLTM